MPTIVRLTPIESIKPGPNSTTRADGTLTNPQPYRAVDIEFDDGSVIQVERPLTVGKIRAAKAVTDAERGNSIDGIDVGKVIT